MGASLLFIINSMCVCVGDSSGASLSYTLRILYKSERRGVSPSATSKRLPPKIPEAHLCGIKELLLPFFSSAYFLPLIVSLSLLLHITRIQCFFSFLPTILLLPSPHHERVRFFALGISRFEIYDYNIERFRIPL